MSSFLNSLARDPGGPQALINRRNGRILASSLEAAFESDARRRGLLGRESLDSGAALIIAPCSCIHMFFMRFAIDVLFADRDGCVVKACRHVKPWRVAGAWGAFAAIELPVGAVDVSGTREGDYLEIGASSTLRGSSGAATPSG
jgi:uncharacterized membrane protein (UPF0127 family)